MERKKKRGGKIIYFTDDELKLIEKKARLVNKNSSEYIKEMTLKGFIIQYDLETINELSYEINKIGVNINQISKRVNEDHVIYKYEVEKIENYMTEIWKIINDYIGKFI